MDKNIKISWRFKTEAEFRADGEWVSSYGYPDGWADEMKKFVGAPVPEEFWSKCERSQPFSDPDWYFRSSNYVKVETPIGRVTGVATKVSWRFKTEAEFKADDRWQFGCPKYWVPTMVERHLGKPVPEELWEKCEQNKGFSTGGYTYEPMDYIKVEAKSHVTSKISRLVEPQKPLR